MRALVLTCVFVFAPACRLKNPDQDGYPVLGGGGGGGGGGVGDGGGQGIDAPTGRLFNVCLLVDPRNLVKCAATGAGGYTVTLTDGTIANTFTTTTSDDGRFYLPAQTGSGFSYKVTGTDIQTSIELYNNAMVIPIIKTAAFLTLQSNNSAVTTSGHGDLFVRVTKNAVPQSGISASTTPATSEQLYDATSMTVWNRNTATGPLGTIWIPNTQAGMDTLTLQTGTTINIPNIPVVDGALTFFKAEI